MWLCDANEAKGNKEDGAGYVGVSARARRWKRGQGSPEDPDWVCYCCFLFRLSSNSPFMS